MRKIWKLVLNDFISSSTIQAFNIYTIWYIAQITKDQKVVALFGSMGIINILLSPIGGVFADSHPKDQIIKTVSFIRSILFCLFFIIVLFLKDFRYAIILLAFMLSIISSFYTPAIESIVPNISADEKELFTNNTYINTANQLSSIIGAGIGGILVIIINPSLAYLLITVLMSISALFIMSFTTYMTKGSSKTNSHIPILSRKSVKKIIHNTKAVCSFPIIKVLLPYACLINLSFWLYYYLMPIYLSNQFTKYKFAYSLQEFIIAFSAFICGLILSKFSDYFLKKSYLYVFYLFMQSIGIVLMPLLFMLFTNELVKLVILIIAWFLYGIFNFLSGLIFITKIQQLVDNSRLGITFGIIFSIFGALGPISAGLSGFISQITSGIVFSIGSIMLLITIIMFFDKRIYKFLQ